MQTLDNNFEANTPANTTLCLKRFVSLVYSMNEEVYWCHKQFWKFTSKFSATHRWPSSRECCENEALTAATGERSHHHQADPHNMNRDGGLHEVLHLYNEVPAHNTGAREEWVGGSSARASFSQQHSPEDGHWCVAQQRSKFSKLFVTSVNPFNQISH